MKPEVVNNYSVRAICPDCDNAITIYDETAGGREVGYHLINKVVMFEGVSYSRTHWRMVVCSGCGRAGLAKFYDNGRAPGVLESFYPTAIQSPKLPVSTPAEILNEYREAETCANAGAWRAASVMLRSSLEKTLKANGYINGSLASKIDEAADDGIITSSRRQKAHSEVRVLGNEVVHEEWKVVTNEEVVSSLHYVQRVIEDFYDDRAEVERILIELKRITAKE